MQQMEPANKVMPRARNISDPRTVSRTCTSDLTTEEEVSVYPKLELPWNTTRTNKPQKPDILAVLLTEVGKTSTTPENVPQAAPRTHRLINRPGRPPIFHMENANTDDDSSMLMAQNGCAATKPPELTNVQMLLVSGLLYGYSLREGKWGKPTIFTTLNHY
jgi:hypothetical protein